LTYYTVCAKLVATGFAVEIGAALECAPSWLTAIFSIIVLLNEDFSSSTVDFLAADLVEGRA
jgi:hypothetical protein